MAVARHEILAVVRRAEGGQVFLRPGPPERPGERPLNEHMVRLLDLFDHDLTRSQASIIEHAQVHWGWPRSTTRNRLTRLMRLGLLVCRANGHAFQYGLPPAPAKMETL